MIAARTAAQPVERHAVSWWGMLGFSLTEVTLFGTLMASALYLRTVTPVLGANGGVYPDLRLPLLMTVILVTSSITVEWARRQLQRGAAGTWRALMILSAMLGVVFLLVQAREYSEVVLGADVNALRAVMLATTTLHGAHVGLGVLMNVFVQARRSPRQPKALMQAMENFALYWHVVDGIWIGIVVVFYVGPRL